MIHILLVGLVVLLVCAVVIYVIQSWMPGDVRIKQLACFVVAVIGLLIWLAVALPALGVHIS